ncbi:MAG: hypothetical protein H6Q70_3208 [Firmicutes bacterium]|nr:hypothetical protein [Bacillota bacterium]
MKDVVKKFYDQVDKDDALADRLDQLSKGEFNIEKILCSTIEIAKEYGYVFNLKELKEYLVHAADEEDVSRLEVTLVQQGFAWSRGKK